WLTSSYIMRNYKRKTSKGSYDKNDLREAILSVRNGRLSGYKAAQLYKIPRMTIMDHVNRKRIERLAAIAFCGASKPSDDDFIAMPGTSGMNTTSTRKAKNISATSFKITAKKLPKTISQKGKGIVKKSNSKENEDPKPPKTKKKSYIAIKLNN
ncbi:hypothetical protein ACJJTC_012979, partial [Scirpophaga incertulas]